MTAGQPLRVGDTVRFHDAVSGKRWTGQVIALRPDAVYVRWSDNVVGVFARKYDHHLKREVREARSA